ncbi:unnamed protein product, partial [Rotaria sordida]
INDRCKNYTDNDISEKQHRIDEDRLIDLALNWNCIDEILPISEANPSMIFFYNRTLTMKFIDYQFCELVGEFNSSIYHSSEDDNHSNVVSSDTNNVTFQRKNWKLPYTEDELFRDLFLWSILMDMPEMAKIFLVYVPSTLCAALIASTVFKRYAECATTVGQQETFRSQAHEFETHAAKIIDKCYEVNEKVAFELLLRQVPFFGDVTCMQVAIASKSEIVLKTKCFDQALTEVWYDKLSIQDRELSTILCHILSVLSFGFCAPFLLKYRAVPNESKNETLSSEGINYYIGNDFSEKPVSIKFLRRVKYFHESPSIKMWYHLISYIWFLLVFSYMMLYHFDSRATFKIPHWTEIYVIITIATMICEDIRMAYHNYTTKMTEQWASIPYLFFFIGLGFRYGNYNEKSLSTARIWWAFDLELWYLGSLRFIMTLKFFGQKLLKLQNMFQDLFGFAYIIFIAISAYGVVSRSLIFYNEIPFTGNEIFKQIYYQSYWFIYGENTDKDLLDEKIKNGTSFMVYQATATHILLAFHMLFINILLLNLLIAVFTDTIGAVQNRMNFHWSYKRYLFVREYFERLPFAFPPLTLLAYLILLFRTIYHQYCQKLFRNQIRDQNNQSTSKSHGIVPIFKMIPVDKLQQNKSWDRLENALLRDDDYFGSEKKRENLSSITDDTNSKTKQNITASDTVQPFSNQEELIRNMKTEISAIKSAINNNQKDIHDMKTQIKHHMRQANESFQWIMNALARVKMNNPNEPPPILSIPD